MSDNDRENYSSSRKDQSESSSNRNERNDRSGRRDDRSSNGKSDRGGYRSSKSRSYFRKKVCRFCTQNYQIDYKNPDSMMRFLTDRGKILPRRITGTCAKHQRMLATEIKRARALALIPFAKK